MKIYVGKLPSGKRRTIKSDIVPTMETHGYESDMVPYYVIVEGPFRTMRGAKMYCSIWNSGGQCTQDMAEECAKKERDARRTAQHTALGGIPRGFRKGDAPSMPRT